MRVARQSGSAPILAVTLTIMAGLVLAVTGQFGALRFLALQTGAPSTPAANRQTVGTTADLIVRLQERLRSKPDDIQAYSLLANAYLQRVRETGDPTYYAKTDAVLAGGLTRDPRNVEALIAKGSLALARHDFRTGLALGEQARALNPTIPRIYGVIADAQIELGKYDDAVKTVQTMVDMRPDLSSYSRVSYLRELYGDLTGAIDAMQEAVAAGGPNAENTQWSRVQLANLYFTRGDLATAEQLYRHALAALPDYVHAQAGLARVRAAQGNYDEAIALYTRAVTQMPLPEYVIALGDVYAAKGDAQRARKQYDLVQAINTLFTANGVNTDLETALFFADHNIDLPASLAKAHAAYAARPSIHTADGLAWTLYNAGRAPEAERYAAEALRLNTRDPLKLFHAGMIARALGRRDAARTYLAEAIHLNPHFSLRYSELAATTLRELGGTPASTTGGNHP